MEKEEKIMASQKSSFKWGSDYCYNSESDGSEEEKDEEDEEEDKKVKDKAEDAVLSQTEDAGINGDNNEKPQEDDDAAPGEGEKRSMKKKMRKERKPVMPWRIVVKLVMMQARMKFQLLMKRIMVLLKKRRSRIKQRMRFYLKQRMRV